MRKILSVISVLWFLIGCAANTNPTNPKSNPPSPSNGFVSIGNDGSGIETAIWYNGVKVADSFAATQFSLAPGYYKEIIDCSCLYGVEICYFNITAGVTLHGSVSSGPAPYPYSCQLIFTCPN